LLAQRADTPKLNHIHYKVQGRAAQHGGAAEGCDKGKDSLNKL
jgi:hypothetical protein